MFFSSFVRQTWIWAWAFAIECEITENDWLSATAAAVDDVDGDDVVEWCKFRFHVGVPFNHDINKYFKPLVWHVFIYIKRHWCQGN